MTLKKTAKIRLFVEESSLCPEEQILLPEKQSHYLQNVMKQNIGSRILCFDGKSGEYECELVECGKKACRIKVLQKTKNFSYSDIDNLIAKTNSQIGFLKNYN